MSAAVERRHVLGFSLLAAMLAAPPALAGLSLFVLSPQMRPLYYMAAAAAAAAGLVLLGDYLIQRHLEAVSAWLNGTARAAGREARRQWDHAVRQELQAALYFAASDIIARAGRGRRRAAEWLDASVREPIRLYLVTVGREIAAESSHARHTFAGWLATLTKPQPRLTYGATPYEVMARMTVCPEAAAATRAVDVGEDGKCPVCGGLLDGNAVCEECGYAVDTGEERTAEQETERSPYRDCVGRCDGSCGSLECGTDLLARDISHIDSAAYCILCGSDPCVCQHLSRELTPDEAEAAYDAAVPVELSDERINEIVRYATQGRDLPDDEATFRAVFASRDDRPAGPRPPQPQQPKNGRKKRRARRR